MSDEIASATLSTSQKAIEVALELIKMLAPLAQRFLAEVYHKSVDGMNNVGGKIANAKSMGTVSTKNLIVEAQKAGSPISTTSNFLARDAELVVKKAKEYGIPVSVIGSGEKQTIEFLDRDKGVIEQITNEIMQERLKETPQSVKCFSVGENSVSSMKTLFEENGIECQFVKSANGKISCIYPVENAEQVAVLKSDYKAVYSSVKTNCKITPVLSETAALEQADGKKVVVSDEVNGKSVEMTADSKLRKSDVMNILREELGYSAVQADIAANKLCYEMGLDQEKYFTKPTQLENINVLKTNIRYESDDLTIRNIRFDAVNFKDGEQNHFILQNGDKAVGLTPAKMSRDKMKSVCVGQLGLSEYQAEKAVAKAIKIESQVRSQIEERAVNKQGISKEIGIERTSNSTFVVRFSGMSKAYDFSEKNLDETIAFHFDIPKENARNIIAKAKNQSVLQNKIHNATKKKTKATPTAEAPKINTSKGLKRK